MTLDEMEAFADFFKADDVAYSSNLTDYFGKTTSFSTLGELVSFLTAEYDFWDKALANLPATTGHLSRIKNETLTNIKSFISEAQKAVTTKENQNLPSQLQNLYRSHLQALENNWINSNHPAVERIVKLYKDHNYTVVDTFLAILKNPNQNHSIQYPNQMIAFFEYYKFKGYDTDGLFDFAQSTEKSIDNIRHKLEQSSNQLFEKMHSKHEFFDKWHQDQIKQFETQQESQSNKHVQQVSEQSNTFDSNMTEWQKRIKDLEDQYKENLRFQGPAEHWQHAANTHIFWSMLWATVLVVVVVFGLIEISAFFKTWLQGKELSIQLDTLQGAALFIAFASAYAFIISILSKLTLSSVHLYRDAKEREQLTHLYLSLADETKLDDETRKIVLQSLFSRADTGLLGKDGGHPVMPMIDMLRRD